MSLIEALRAEPALLVGAAALFGLLLGSFLNVVSLRLPPMMEAGWKLEARSILELAAEDPPPAPLSLWHPPSRCPQCGAGIRPWHNIPVFGWLWLRGRCADCRAPISVQYPLVELAAGVLGGLCAWRLGWGPQLAAALPLAWALLVLTVIDLRVGLLPDSITLPLVWAGLLLSCLNLFVGPVSSILGAAIGYLTLRAIDEGYKKLMKADEGMGQGDAKLLAALGAWFGASSLLTIILLSSMVGSVIGLSLMALGKAGRRTKIPFGPYLAGAGLLLLLWGPALHRLLRL